MTRLNPGGRISSHKHSFLATLAMSLGALLASPPVARYRWAMLLACIYAVFPLTGPFSHAEMRIITFITEPRSVRQILVESAEVGVRDFGR